MLSPALLKLHDSQNSTKHACPLHYNTISPISTQKLVTKISGATLDAIMQHILMYIVAPLQVHCYPAMLLPATKHLYN